MKQLAIDCTTQKCHLAIINDGEISQVTLDGTQRHTDHILLVIDKLLKQHKLSLANIEQIIYTAGPGGFTGIRVGVAVVQALSLAHEIPVVPLSSLEVLAQGASRRLQAQHILVAKDARMNEVYWALYRTNSQDIVEAIKADCLSQPQAISIPIVENCFGVGDALKVYGEQMDPTIAALKWDNVEEIAIEDMLQLAQVKNITENSHSGLALPHYIRDDVAQKKAQNKLQ